MAKERPASASRAQSLATVGRADARFPSLLVFAGPRAGAFNCVHSRLAASVRTGLGARLNDRERG